MHEEESRPVRRATAESAFHLAVASLALTLLALAATTAARIWGIWYGLEALACFAPLLAIPGVISGHMALRALKHGGRARGIRGTAIAGLVTGYAALAWFVFFFAYAATRGTGPSRQPSCRNNLKQIGLALHIYSTDYDEWFPIGPPETDSSYALGILAYGEEPYIPWAEIFICPGSDDRVGAWPRREAGHSAAQGGLRPSSTSYVYLAGTKSSDHPDSMVVFDDDAARHENGRNVLFVDGRAEYLKEEEFAERLIWQMQVLLGQRHHSAD